VNENEVFEQRKKIQFIIKEMAENEKRYEKRLKRLKILLAIIVGYIISILVIGLLPIFFPSMERYSEIYLYIGNVIGLLAGIGNVYYIFKVKMIKHKEGKWLLVLGIFCILINLFALFDNYILERFIL
jgi:hypothetical protein